MKELFNKFKTIFIYLFYFKYVLLNNSEGLTEFLNEWNLPIPLDPCFEEIFNNDNSSECNDVSIPIKDNINCKKYNSKENIIKKKKESTSIENKIINSNKSKKIKIVYPEFLNEIDIKIIDLPINTKLFAEYLNKNKKNIYNIRNYNKNLEQFYRPYIIITNKIIMTEHSKSNKLYFIIDYILKNMPTFLVNLEFNNIKDFEIISQIEIKKQFYFFNEIFLRIKIPIKSSILISNLFPKIVFIEIKNFINKKYIGKIDKWSYKIYDFNSFKDSKFKEINIPNDIKTQSNLKSVKKFRINNNIRFFHNKFLNKKGNIKLNNILKNTNKTDQFYLIRLEIENILEEFNKHLNLIKDLEITKDSIKDVIKSIYDILKLFKFIKLENIENYNFSSEDCQFFSIYYSFFKNFIPLASSIIDIYNFYLREETDEVLFYFIN